MFHSLLSKRLTFLYVIIIICAGIYSCTKNDINSQPLPKISIVPAITLKSVVPTTVHQLTDSIVFTIHYVDGDGDLGYANADSNSVVVTDNRFPLNFYYHLQPLAPLNTTEAISGDLPIVMPNTILQNPNDQQETATFSIKIKDRAGHWSNTVTTGNITILP
jgi:hypothetical protein